MAFGERIGSTWASMRAHPIWSAALVVLAAAASGFFASLWDKLLFERFTAPLAQWIGDAAASLVTTALTLVVAMALVAGVIAATAWLTWRVTSATINPHHNAPPSDGGSAYWTLTEAISWIAFGDAVEATGWPALLQRMQINAAEERHRFMAAERAFIMKMRDPNAGIDIVGKEDGKDGIHMPIQHYVFLSDIGLSILDNRIGMPNRADIGTIMHWVGPKWSEVRVRQSHVRHTWKGDVGRQTMSLIEAAKIAYGRNRLNVIGKTAEIRLSGEDRQDGTLTWFCNALEHRAFNRMHIRHA